MVRIARASPSSCWAKLSACSAATSASAMSSPAGQLKGALGKLGGRGRVRLDQLEGGLRQLERVVPTSRNCHAGRCIKTLHGVLSMFIGFRRCTCT